MLIVMTSGASDADIERVIKAVESAGYRAHPMPGANRTAIGITGNAGPID
ncbi:MAG: 3-deoxy-7-phosphoheptulonate synthase, partial [Blastocatellia bacterium]